MNSLLDLEIPSLNLQQINRFHYQNLRVVNEGEFDIGKTLDTLRQKVGQSVIGIDIGGDKAITQLFKVSEKGLVPDASYTDFQQDKHGKGYLESLERTSLYAQNNNIPVGLSIGIPIEGTRLANSPKLPALQEDLVKYSGDLSAALPNLKACINDGPAGLAVPYKQTSPPRVLLITSSILLMAVVLVQPSLQMGKYSLPRTVIQFL